MPGPTLRTCLFACLVWLLCIGSLGAQSQTGFLGLAGIVCDPAGSPLDGILVRVRSTATSKVVTTVTPSSAGAAAGFYFVALADFAMNRAAAVGDVLEFSCFRRDGAQISTLPRTIVVTSGDIESSLRKTSLTVDPSFVGDTIPPQVRISVSAARRENVPPGPLVLTATFSEDIDSQSQVELQIVAPDGGRSLLAVRRVSPRLYVADYMLATGREGLFLVLVAGAKDLAGNLNAQATDNAFRSGDLMTQLELSVGWVDGRDCVSVPVSLFSTRAAAGSLSFWLEYKPAKLRFLGANLSPDEAEAGFAMATNETEPGHLRTVVFGLGEHPLQSGEVLRLLFSVSQELPAGTVCPLVLSHVEASDLSGGQFLAATGSNGRLTVRSPVGSLRGLVLKGGFVSGTAQAFALQPALPGGLGVSLGSSSLGTDSRYALAMAVQPEYRGPVIVSAVGTYLDEASGAFVAVDIARALKGATVRTGGDALCNVTALNHLAAVRALQLMGSALDKSAGAIDQANQEIAAMFELPAEALSSADAQRWVTEACGAIARIGRTAGVGADGALDVVQALEAFVTGRSVPPDLLAAGHTPATVAAAVLGRPVSRVVVRTLEVTPATIQRPGTGLVTVGLENVGTTSATALDLLLSASPSAGVTVVARPGNPTGLAAGATASWKYDLTVSASAAPGPIRLGACAEDSTPGTGPARWLCLPDQPVALTVTRPPNHPPLALAGPDRTVSAGTTVPLTGGGSDLDGDPLTYRWSVESGAPATLTASATARACFTAPAAGQWRLRLTVSDDLGGLADGFTTITAVVPNRWPTVTPAATQILATVRNSGAMRRICRLSRHEITRVAMTLRCGDGGRPSDGRAR
ncbi:MAG: PKD domain-containing protein [Candidatus Riflebacteria bacterium]|nr:PKD domain-containing protein [Candidatus Riflebacteria bacterium]